MRDYRTYSGPGFLLAAALWSSACALWGCTSGIAEPIYSASEIGAAARGAAGHGQTTAGTHGAAGSGAGGSLAAAGSGNRGGAGGANHGDAGTAKTPCAITWPWDPNSEQQEQELLGLLNTAIENNKPCADRPFNRSPFVMDDDLQCMARQMAILAVNGKPSMMGHDPFSPQDQPTTKQANSASAALDQLLSDPMACARLSSHYPQLGIGRFGSVWALAFPD